MPGAQRRELGSHCATPRVNVTSVLTQALTGAVMWFGIPAGRVRMYAAAVAGVLILGWLSGRSPATTGGGQGSAAASGRPVGPASRQGPGHAARRKRPPRPPRPPAEKVDCRVRKCVALTFDDGPGPYTTKLLRMLAARHARVTFFLIGRNILGREGVVRQEVAQGQAVGDHNWSHPDLSRLPKPAVWFF